MRLPNHLAAELPEIENWIDGAVQIEGMDILEKAQCLEHLLWLYRASKKNYELSVEYEDILASGLFIDDDSIALDYRAYVSRYFEFCKGTRPVTLQPLLLQYLLLQGNQWESVLESLNQFIGRIHDRLDTLDYKRTKTGVIRCFTNTRFAANALRKFGFLRYTQQEAYKCWKLTLPGLLTAGYFYLKPLKEPTYCVTWYGLHPEFTDVIGYFSHPENCIATLEKLSAGNSDIFKSYQPMLESFASDFSQWMSRFELADSDAKRRREKKTWVEYIDRQNDWLEFADDFCMDMQIRKTEMNWWL